MAGGGGGAWKVAYADFVTAMMAFFMVMWLVSQDEKIKESVAKYFVEPVGFTLSGSSSRPKDASGLFQSESTGRVPGAKNRTSGQGRGDMKSNESMDSETTMIADSILEEPRNSEKWVGTARRILAEAKNSQDVAAGNRTEAEAAKSMLAKELKQHFQSEALNSTEGLIQDLVSSSLTRVDFEELADELIRASALERE